MIFKGRRRNVVQFDGFSRAKQEIHPTVFNAHALTPPSVPPLPPSLLSVPPPSYARIHFPQICLLGRFYLHFILRCGLNSCLSTHTMRAEAARCYRANGSGGDPPPPKTLSPDEVIQPGECHFKPLHKIFIKYVEFNVKGSEIRIVKVRDGVFSWTHMDTQRDGCIKTR